MAHCCFSVSTAVSSARKPPVRQLRAGRSGRPRRACIALSRSRLAGIEADHRVSSSALACHGEVKLAAKLMGDRMIEPKASG